MANTPMGLNEALVDERQDVSLPFQDSQRDSQVVPDWLDAFVLAHSALEFEPFFLCLRRLEAWHDLLAHLDAFSYLTMPLPYRTDWRRKPHAMLPQTTAKKEDMNNAGATNATKKLCGSCHED